SLNSLFFADRCQNVQNKPIQNVAKADAEGNERQISKLTLEIVNLKHQLEVADAAQGPGAPGGNPGAGRAPVGVSGVKSIRSQRSMRSGVGQMSMAGSMMSQQPSEQLDLGDVLDQ
ncbi:Rps20, partial [Symbiodinium sp. KB8]